MKPSFKRLFINNLPDKITESDLQTKFSNYGDVCAVEIKNRKNIGVNQTLRFAYIHINTKCLEECINDFSNKKWNGNWLTVQEAKESFMDKLKREREEEKSNAVPAIKKSTEIETNSANHVNNVEIFVSNNTKRYHSSSSSSSEEEECEDERVNKTKVNSKKCKVEDKNKLPDRDTKKDTPKSSKEQEADQKRLQSLVNMKKSYQQQKLAIRSALANVDAKPRNKIIFNDDDLNHSTQENFILHASEPKRNSKDKLRLFDEHDPGDNETYDFAVKEQFEGERGRKLMSLQSRFRHDKRFTMDARFLEDETKEVTDSSKQQVEEVSYEEEKEKQLDILEEVLGKKIKRKMPGNDLSTDDARKKPKMMLRFDPTQPEHLKFEMEKGTAKERRKKDEPKKKLQIEPEVVVLPHVSKDTFYKVDMDLKSALQQEKEGFSLANMFDKQIETVEKAKQHEEVVRNNKNSYLHEENPFRYDSSSESENEVPPITEVASGNVQKEKSSVKKLWTESFFFKLDDYRLQEGLDFIKRLQVDEEDDFQKTRRNLRDIVRGKIKNNQRKNRPFKKKLGGKKRLRVKRALKR